MPHGTKRIQVAPERTIPIFADGSTSLFIIDTAHNDRVIAIHRYPLPVLRSPLDKPEYHAAHLKVAQGIADALNAAPAAAIEFIHQSIREADHIRDVAEKSQG